ncbi:MAG: hypothetical protein V4723_18145 [Pseudomonadota bacterium]
MTMKFFVHGVSDLLQRAEAALVALGAERRCAQRLDQIGDRLGLMGEKIDLLRTSMREHGADEAIDPDFCLRESLKGLKEDIRDIRRQLATLQAPQLGARLQRAFARLNKVAEETYASADKLQWEIGEHDRHWPLQALAQPD